MNATPIPTRLMAVCFAAALACTAPTESADDDREPAGAHRVLAAASTEVTTRNENGDDDASDPVAGKVVVDESGTRGTVRWGQDSYQLAAAAVQDDTLAVTLSYGGGCREHEFTLVLSNAFKMTDPVRLAATLAHDADGDPCEAWLTTDVVFDLAPLKRMTRDGGNDTPVILELILADGSLRELHYRPKRIPDRTDSPAP